MKFDKGTGKIDFKFFFGYEARVLVEVKLTNSSRLVQGYIKQLEAYKKAERSYNAVYLVTEVGGPTKRLEKLFRAKNEAIDAKCTSSNQPGI